MYINQFIIAQKQNHLKLYKTFQYALVHERKHKTNQIKSVMLSHTFQTCISINFYLMNWLVLNYNFWMIWRHSFYATFRSHSTSFYFVNTDFHSGFPCRLKLAIRFIRSLMSSHFINVWFLHLKQKLSNLHFNLIDIALCKTLMIICVFGHSGMPNNRQNAIRSDRIIALCPVVIHTCKIHGFFY